MGIRHATRRWRFGRLTAAVAIAGLVMACGSGDPAGEGDATSTTAGTAAGADGEPVTISWLHKWPEPQYAPLFEEIAAEYEEEHPNVTIEIEAVGDQPIKEKLQVLAQSGELPDIYFSWAGDFTKRFVRADLAADLTDAVEGTEWQERVADAGWNAYTYDGSIHGVPINLDAKFFVYNQEIFAEHGIEEPQTLDDLYAACDVLNEAGVEPIAFGNQFGWPAIHYLSSLNARYVPSDVRDTDYDPATGEWSHPGYEQALQTLVDIKDRCMADEVNGVPHDDAVAKVQIGEAAMVFVQSVEFDKFTEQRDAPETIVGNWDFFRFPTIEGAEGDQESLTGAPDGFLVSANSPNQDVAIDFLKFFTNQANGTKLIEQMGRLSSVADTASTEVATPQLVEALDVITNASDFNIWLDTVVHQQVASSYLSGGEALLGGTSGPSEVMTTVVDAAEQAAETTSD